MTFTIITLFPETFKSTFSQSLIKRAQEEEKIAIKIINLRDFGLGRHKVVDDKPYSGGVGMMLRVDVIDKAISFARIGKKGEKVLLLDPKGEKYNQGLAVKFSTFDHLILVCGHYEGVDGRVKKLVDYEVSIGDYVLSGGEIPAMVIVDSVARLVKGVLRKNEATVLESFSKFEKTTLLEYPQYTRPRAYKNMRVPKILLSGNKKKIEEYKREKALEETKKRRPDLLITSQTLSKY